MYCFSCKCATHHQLGVRQSLSDPPRSFLAQSASLCARHALCSLLRSFLSQVNLWEAENAVQARYSLHQLQYLSAIIDTSAAKVGY